MTQESAADAVILLQQAAVWHRDGEVGRAEVAAREALALDPGNPDALNLLAMILHGLGDVETAITLLRRAVAISPTGRLWSNLGVVLSGARDYVGSVAAYRKAVAIDPLNLTSWTNLLFSLDHHPYATPALRLAERRRFDGWLCQPRTNTAPPYENTTAPDRRLRIGYVSGDWRNHSASMAFAPAVFGRDPEQFEIFCYDTWDGQPDQETARFKAAADAWRPISDLSDDEAARQIREDQIDILVDLSGYSTGHRLLVFARKPAPIQITAWGHATGVGLDCIDYLVSDAVMIPPEHDEHHHEQILRIPSMMGFDTRPPYPDVSPPPAQRNGYVTFGNLGRGAKLHEQILAAWADLLRRVPTSRLLLKGQEYASLSLRAWVLDVLGALGVAPERIEIRPTTTRMRHLATYNEIDVHLDSFPHNGGVTTLDACLMGVPTVTLLGDYVPGRLAAAILQTVGEYTVAHTTEEYIQMAAMLGQSSFGVADRLDLRRRLLDSIICNERAFARSVEDAYREVWRRWCAGQREGADLAPVLAGALV